MAGQKISWSAAKYQRLLAATIAAHPELKVNYTKIAGMFGEGATYDSIETRYRVVKKEAKALRAEIESGLRSAEPAPTPRKRKQSAAAAAGLTASPTPKKRATAAAPRSANATPAKKGKAAAVVRQPVTPPPPPPRQKPVAVKVEALDDGEAPEDHWSAGTTEEDEVGYSRDDREYLF